MKPRSMKRNVPCRRCPKCGAARLPGLSMWTYTCGTENLPGMKLRRSKLCKLKVEHAKLLADYAKLGRLALEAAAELQIVPHGDCDCVRCRRNIRIKELTEAWK